MLGRWDSWWDSRRPVAKFQEQVLRSLLSALRERRLARRQQHEAIRMYSLAAHLEYMRSTVTHLECVRAALGSTVGQCGSVSATLSTDTTARRIQLTQVDTRLLKP